MKIYLDLYFLINYILDIALLIGTAKLLKIHVKTRRYLLGSLFGTISIFLLFIKLDNITLFIIKCLISIGMIIITFGFNNIIRNTFYFYILSIILGGVFYLLDINFDYTSRSYYFNYLILIIFSPIIIYFICIEYLKGKKININKYFISIKYKDIDISTYGYIDTGNCLKDPYFNRDIILIDNNITIDKPILVPFKALNNTGIINCFKPDKLIINNKEYSNYLIGISTNKLNLMGCNCILPNSLLEEL